MNSTGTGAKRLFDDFAWGLRHDAFEDEAGRRAAEVYGSGVCDDVIAGIIEERVARLKKREVLGDLVPFRNARLYNGELALNRGTIRAPVKWFTEHSLIASGTGGGKTTFFTWLLIQLMLLGVIVWVSDPYKRQLRHLRPLVRQAGVDLIVLRARDWKFNLLQCVGDSRTFLARVVDILVRCLTVPPRASVILRQGCHELYQRFGIWSGRTDAYPTLFDLFEWVRTTKGLNEAAKEAILDRLGSLLISLTPRCAAYRVGWKSNDLSRHSIVFELDGSSEVSKQLLLESNLFAVFQNQIEQGIVNSPLKLFVAWDDSQRYLSSSNPELTPIEELAGIVRGAGIGLCILAQSVEGLPPLLRSNLGMKFMGRLGTHQDYQTLSADMGLTQDQLRWARLNLRPGRFVGQMSSGNWREPFLFEVPLINVPPVVDDAEIDASIRALDYLPTVFANEFEKWEPRSRMEVPSDTLSETEHRYLKAVVAEPGRPSGYYARTSGVGGGRAAEIKERLIRNGLIRQHEVATGGRGRNALVLEPLPAGIQAAGGRI